MFAKYRIFAFAYHHLSYCLIRTPVYNKKPKNDNNNMRIQIEKNNMEIT